MITSRQNEFIKRIASLKEKKYRAAYGEYIIEGVKQVREAVQSGQKIVNIVVSPRYEGERFAQEKVIDVSESVFAKISEEAAPQGILAVLQMPQNTVRPPEGKCLLLDGLADPGNLGTIIRTANAAGYTEIYLKNCTDPYAPKCVRSAMSGIFFVRLFRIDSLGDLFSCIPLLCADISAAGEVLPRDRKRGERRYARCARAMRSRRAHSHARELRKFECWCFGGYFDVSTRRGKGMRSKFLFRV